ncbi:MAG: hypothetical protein IJJ23_03890 [Clostridia bacterium]|nr:hypothetical protein [Clostridia bacterium]
MEEKMPSKGVYTALLVLGFLCGIIWGALSVTPYKNMKAAIEHGDVAGANADAKKIRTFVIIGVVVNALVIIGRMAQG